MNIKRATALALSLSLLLGAAACGKSDSEAADTGSKTSAHPPAANRQKPSPS